VPDETTPPQPDSTPAPDDDNPYAAPVAGSSEPTQQLPAEGQQPPVYGQQPPAYGQQPPAYGQQPPAYGQAPQPPGYGQAAAYGQQYSGYPSTSGRATAVLICGIASLVLLLSCIGFIPAIVALALAPGAQRDIAASGGRLTGEGQIKAGRICSWIAIAINILIVLAIMVFVVAFRNADFSDPTYDGY
jgi:hypothetical protein